MTTADDPTAEPRTAPQLERRARTRARTDRAFGCLSAPNPAPNGSKVEEKTVRQLPRPRKERLVLLELRGAHPGALYSIQVPGALIGRAGNADVVLEDETISGEHARLTLENDGAYLEDLSSRNGTFVNDWPIAQRTRLYDGDYLSLGGGTVVKFSMMDALEENALRTLFELTLRDPLTRLYNRQYFDDRLRNEFAFAKRHDTLLGLLLIDVDHFKQVNDTLGHLVGDIVLRVIAGSLEKLMRPEDVLGRYGGEEFVVIARATSLQNLEILGARVCQRIEALSADFASYSLTVTVSVGVSCMGPEAPCATADALLTAADQALYGAKAAGRNRTCAGPQGAGE